MAQEKSPNEKPRQPRKPKVMNDAPLVEQITELMMIHNKSDPKAGVQVVSEIDKDGKPTGERTTTTAHSEASDYLCGNAIPDLYGGFGTSVSFFGFDFGINFNYQIGGKIYDSGYAAAMSTP